MLNCTDNTQGHVHDPAPLNPFSTISNHSPVHAHAQACTHKHTRTHVHAHISVQTHTNTQSLPALVAGAAFAMRGPLLLPHLLLSLPCVNLAARQAQLDSVYVDLLEEADVKVDLLVVCMCVCVCDILCVLARLVIYHLPLCAHTYAHMYAHILRTCTHIHKMCFYSTFTVILNF
jgi:hypothetical protein